ncbi:hypothetical protein O181_073054 [Austropuccinia psidii MF-1]|uniref:Uncharacterized protein n=1 Tax=Austropuccinia psidii MF-1 TaxID=1389203 RepID=A0A9Q3F5Y2_9BASI|nr:hypothetical protein [Austropuccinia psidii MF-1]
MAINHHRTHFGPGSPWTTFQPMAPGNHQRPPDQLSSILPLTLRGILPFLHAPHTQGCTRGASMVLYTIMHHFCSAIQWGRFRTQFQLSKSRSQNPIPILKEDSLTHQSGNLWQQSEEHSRIPITWPCRSWVGNSFRSIPRAILIGYTFFQSVVKASSISILLGQLNWSIQAAVNQAVCTSPDWANSYSTVGIQSHR